jgi:hypothetical protein
MSHRTRTAMTALVLLVAGCAARPPAPGNPYTADQVVRLLRGAVSPDRILYDAARECIAFRVTPELRAQLAEAGAPATFADSLNALCYLAPRAAGT